MKPRPLPDAEYLRSVLDYDSATGDLIWKRRPREHFVSDNSWRTWNSRYAGRKAGWLHAKGYRALLVGGVKCLAHRVVWKIVYGVDPPADLDHRRGAGKTENQIENLRPASRGDANKRIRRDCHSGFKGVTPAGNRRWMAQITAKRKHYYLGSFDTPEEAHTAYCEAARRFHGEFFNPG